MPLVHHLRFRPQHGTLRLPAGRAAFVLPVVAAVLGAASLVAQTPAQRDSIEAFRDSIAPLRDTVALRALERTLIAEAKADRNTPMRHYRLGFLALQLGDAGRRASYDDAAGEFQWATELAPEEPYGWYGLGLAENAIGDSPFALVAGIQAMFRKDHLTKAAGDFAKAAEVDPSFVRGLVELGNTALEQRLNVKLDLALQALRRSAATAAGANPAVLLVRGRVERLAGDPDSALAAFRAYTAAPGADTALGLLEQARTMFLLNSLDGQRPYYEVAALDDTSSVNGLRRDLVPLVDDTTLAGFDSSRGSARADWLRRFWADRDAADLRRPGERVREHYRRLFYARRNFRLVSTHRHYAFDERYRSYDRDFDDRGIIYIRHGEPTERAASHLNGLPPNESWRYARPDGDLVFHFVAREDVQDYRLVGSLFDILGSDQALAVSNGVVPTTTMMSARDVRAGNAIALPDAVRAEATDLLVTREHLAPIYGRLLASNVNGRALLSSERAMGERSIRRGTTSDSYALSFTGDLPGTRWELLLAGQDGDSALAHLVYAIPGRALEPVVAQQGMIYPIRVRLAVLGRDGAPAATLDSTSFFLSRGRIAPTDWLVGRVAVPLRPGTYTYRIAIQNGDADGFSTAPDTVRVPRPGAFALSDVVAGARTSNLYWRDTPTDTVFFNPVSSQRGDVPLEVFYQVLGLQPGDSIHTELRVRKPGGGGLFKPLLRLFGGGGAPVSVAFDGVADGPVTTERRSISIARLAPGSYELELAVSRPGGKPLVRRAAFRVLPPAAGALASSP
ncbi:MAG TPA: GWxTD domain-containing protein [Gemmatimonadales bacterium]|nr:GWxTD domain-containing protein [Gemmatimonadales bacterium]